MSSPDALSLHRLRVVKRVNSSSGPLRRALAILPLAFSLSICCEVVCGAGDCRCRRHSGCGYLAGPHINHLVRIASTVAHADGSDSVIALSDLVWCHPSGTSASFLCPRRIGGIRRSRGSSTSSDRSTADQSTAARPPVPVRRKRRAYSAVEDLCGCPCLVAVGFRRPPSVVSPESQLMRTASEKVAPAAPSNT